MNDTQSMGDEQLQIWNGAAGQAWVEQQVLLDRLFRPLEAVLAEAAAARPGGQALDVGCGTGSTTIAMAARLGDAGRCVGIDISGPMIAAARARAESKLARANFIQADAQTFAFEAGAFDLVASRFGVMFFADPVAAFANLRRATKSGGDLLFFAWRGAEENPFMTTAERAAAPLLPALPPRPKEGPGQFAFADADRVRAILDSSGWSGIEVSRFDFPCAFPQAELERYLVRLGPLGRVLAEADEATKTRIVEAVRPAFDPYLDGGTVRFDAACWEVRARAA